MEQEYGSVLRGMRKRESRGLYSFREGMETLTDALANGLRRELRLGEGVSQLEEIDADCVVAALPAWALAPLVGIADPFTYASLSLVHLGWKGKVLPKRGYGFLVPSREKGEILGMTWDSELFPRGEGTVLCAMMEEKKPEAALRAVQRYLGIDQPPDLVKITHAEKAITQYELGHEERVSAFEKELPSHVKLLGTSFYGPGVNDAIFRARALVDWLDQEKGSSKAEQGKDCCKERSGCKSFHM